MKHGLLYALACVVVPALIGGFMVVVFNLIDRRRRGQRRGGGDGLPPVDYLI